MSSYVPTIKNKNIIVPVPQNKYKMHRKQTTMTESHKACQNRSRDPMVALVPSIQFPTRFRIESDIMVPNYIFDKQVCDVGHSCFGR